MFALADVAKYLSGRAPRAFTAFVGQVTRVFNFPYERANRAKRFMQIVEDYKAGVPVADIQAKYGCSRNTVLRHARIAGLPKRPKLADPGRTAKIAAMHKQGKSQAEIAEACGCSVAWVSVVETKLGLSRYKRK